MNTLHEESMQSRMQLKKNLQTIDMLRDSFEISSFADSNNEFIKYTKQFPKVNAPTLELQQNNSYTYHKVKKAPQQYEQNQNQGQKFNEFKNGQKLNFLQQITLRNEEDINKKKIKQLEEHLKNKSTTLEETIKQNKRLHFRIIQLQQQLKLKRNQEFKYLNYESRIKNSNCSNSIIDDINNLCPQMLSPDETVLLLGKLIKKISKSNKMTKQLIKDESVKNILNKVIKQ